MKCCFDSVIIAKVLLEKALNKIALYKSLVENGPPKAARCKSSECYTVPSLTICNLG